MDGATLEADVRDDLETELSRLGSSKWLYALTGGEMDAPAVRATADADAEAAARTLAEWADTEDDADAADLFADVADAAETWRDDIGSDEGTPDAPRPVYETLAGFDDTVDRVGGLLGWSLVAHKTAEQLVGFFVGDADPQSADTFRTVRGDVDDARERVVATLDDVCDDGDAWDRANAAATAVVEAAYDHYVESLEALGVKPKNIC